MELDSLAASHEIVENEKRDPKTQQLLGWDSFDVAIYAVDVQNVPHGTSVAAGTTIPRMDSHRAVSVHVELPKEDLTPLESRRLLRQIFRALSTQYQDNARWCAVARLGGEDRAESLPWSRPKNNEAHCFWMVRSDFERPVLAVRVAFANKETLKRIFSSTRARGSTFDSGWDPTAKVWWFVREQEYHRVLGSLRRERFFLRWFQREGFPPAPPVGNY